MIRRHLFLPFTEGPPFNQPKLCPTATWDPNAITFVDSSIIGTNPYDFFMSTNNTIYLSDRGHDQVIVWVQGNSIPSRIISGGMSSPMGIFVSPRGDIYAGNDASYPYVKRWTLTSTNSTIAMYTNGTCYGLFIDRNDDLYCSMAPPHQVFRISTNGLTNVSIPVAGNGTSGAESNMLYNPRGIFVDSNFTLFVAECGNNRVQRFLLGELNGTTVAGNGSFGNFALWCPSKVVLDMDGYLFITDYYNNRVIGSGPLGFRCIAGCTGASGPGSNQLNGPHSLSFDSDNNLFVLEMGNARIQKFLFQKNSCGKYQRTVALPILHKGDQRSTSSSFPSKKRSFTVNYFLDVSTTQMIDTTAVSTITYQQEGT